MLNINSLKEKVLERKDELIEFLRHIIRIPSPTGKEGEVIARIKEEMEKLDYDEIYLSKMGSIIGRIGKGRTKIMYDGHVDTVGVGDIKAWTVDPYEGKLENDMIYGLGACDTKASVASMIYAGGIMKELNLLNDFSLFVIASVMEEDCEGEADRFIIENGEIGGAPDFVVIGEPSSLRIARGNKGRAEICITAKGRSAHASNPSLGENAIYRMAPVIMDIEKLNERLPSHSVMGKGVISVTSIESKSSSRNAVPGECSIFIDRRTVPGETYMDVVDRVNNLPSMKDAIAGIEVYKEKSYTGMEVIKEKIFPPWLIDESEPLLISACKAFELILSRKPDVFTWNFCTNGNYTSGEAGLPTIGFGPGEEIYAHTADEHVSVDHLIDATCFYSGLPAILCKCEIL